MPDNSNNNNSTGVLAVKIALGFALLLTFYVIVQQGGISHQSKYFYYDTSPENDKYIKGNLQPDQLLLLDKILMKEKRLVTHPLSSQQIQSITGDPAVMAAYERWCKCYDMIRSSTHVVYPDERE